MAEISLQKCFEMLGLTSSQRVHNQHFKADILCDCRCNHRFSLKGNTYTTSSVFLIFQVSFDLAEYTANVDAVGTLRLLDAIKTCGMENTVRFYQVHVPKQIIIVIIFNNKNISLMSPESCEISAGSSAGYSSDILKRWQNQPPTM